MYHIWCTYDTVYYLDAGTVRYVGSWERQIDARNMLKILNNFAEARNEYTDSPSWCYKFFIQKEGQRVYADVNHNGSFEIDYNEDNFEIEKEKEIIFNKENKMECDLKKWLSNIEDEVKIYFDLEDTEDIQDSQEDESEPGKIYKETMKRFEELLALMKD
jgi:hypothetical protein